MNIDERKSLLDTAGYIIYLYILKTRLNIEDAKIMILKNKRAIKIFRPVYLKYSRIRDAVRFLIGNSLLIEVPEEGQEITEDDLAVVKYFKNDEIRYVEKDDSLEEAFEILNYAFDVAEEYLNGKRKQRYLFNFWSYLVLKRY